MSPSKRTRLLANSRRSWTIAAVVHVGDVLVREDREHARQRARAVASIADDARVRVVGVAELRVELPGQVEVGVLCVAVRKAIAGRTRW